MTDEQVPLYIVLTLAVFMLSWLLLLPCSIETHMPFEKPGPSARKSAGLQGSTMSLKTCSLYQ